MKRREVLCATLAAVSITGCTPARDATRAAGDNGFAVKAGEGRSGRQFHMRGVTYNRMDVKLSGEDTRGAVAVFEQQGQTPGGGPPLHIHPLQDEWMHILEGEYHFQVGEARYDAHPGDTIYLPRGVQHAFIQLSDRARMLVSYAPAGKMESFFRGTSEWTRPPSAAQVERMFTDHEMKVVGEVLTREG